MLHTLVHAALVGAALALATLPVASQSTPPARVGGISGTVVDSESGRPLAGAAVSLEPDAAAALPGAEGAPFLTAGRSTTSDAEGRYRFDRLPPGRYRLRISRVGYRAASVGVELRGAADSRVSVGLAMQPVALEPLEVRGVAADPFGRAAPLEREIRGGRVEAARARQDAYLASDVRELTHADVVESVTLGETDLFRALQRAPGVGARDDYGADLWVRGASWDQTRVYFDGVPLFNPVHGFGLLSAVNVDAVGGALLHPGVRPASMGEGAAAVLDVTSRSGGGGGRARGMADLSLASGRLALDGRTPGGQGAWMVAARRSWLDLAAAAAARLADDPQLRVPYSFDDVTARFDLQLAGDRALELSGLRERDRITGTIPDVLHRTRAAWGNGAARVTYLAPAGTLRARHTLALSRYDARVREGEADSTAEGVFSAPAEGPSDNALTHLSLSGELAPDLASGRVLPWRVGYALVSERGTYQGPPGLVYHQFEPVAGDSTLVRRGTAARGVLWGERRWGGELGLGLEAGLRLEAGPAVENGGVIRAAPRLTARYAPSAQLSFSAGAGRSYQYTQALAGTGPVLGPGYTASHIWLVADDEAPAIRADVATLGAELWLGREWLLSGNGYARRSTGVALPDLSPGRVIDRPLFVTGTNLAHGLELSARRLAGRWTASGSYSLASSEVEAGGLRFPTSADRRHSLDLTSMLRVGSSLRLGGAFTYASGAPYTRVQGGIVCSAERCESQLFASDPNAQRSGAYSSLDLLVDWTRRFRTWDLGAYLQLRNALGHRNDVTFSSTYVTCPGGGGDLARCPGREEFHDEFQMGLPTVPVIGFRARF